MSQTPVTVTYPIEELLKDINGKLNKLQESVANLEATVGKIQTKTEGLEKRFDDLNGRLNIMTIGFLSIVGVLVTGILTAIGKIVFFPNI